MECYVGVRKTENCKSGWKIKDSFGKGGKATTYGACCEDDCKYVAKHITENTDLKKEVEIQNMAHRYNLAPKIIDYWECSHVGVIIMEAMTMTFESLIKYLYLKNPAVLYPLFVDLLKQFSKLRSLKICHGDLHLSNIMVEYNKLEDVYRGKFSIKFIDFGDSKKDMEDDTCFDFMALYRSLELLKREIEVVKYSKDGSDFINYVLLLLYNTFNYKKYNISKPVISPSMKRTVNIKSPKYYEGVVYEYPDKTKTPKHEEDDDDFDAEFGDEPSEAEMEIFKKMMKK